MSPSLYFFSLMVLWAGGVSAEHKEMGN